MVEAGDKRPTIYFGDDEALWIVEQEEKYGGSKASIVRQCVRYAMEDPEEVFNGQRE